MNALHPLVGRLVELSARPLVDADRLDRFVAEPGTGVLFCGGDPVKYPECLDVAVVLPELAKAHPGRFRIAVAAPGLEATLQVRYGLNRWPSLLFVRDGQYVGTLSGMLDWAVFLERFGALLEAPVSRPPSIGIAVAGSAPTACH